MFLLMLLYSCFILHFGIVYVLYLVSYFYCCSRCCCLAIIVIFLSYFTSQLFKVGSFFGNWGFFVYIQGVPYSLPVFSHFIDADSILGQQGIQETLQNMWQTHKKIRQTLFLYGYKTMLLVYCRVSTHSESFGKVKRFLRCVASLRIFRSLTDSLTYLLTYADLRM